MMCSRTHLADVEIVALSIDLGVAGHELSGIETVSAGNRVAIVIGLNDISVRAVLALEAETQDLAGSEVRAFGVDLRVSHGELVATNRTTDVNTAEREEKRHVKH